MEKEYSPTAEAAKQTARKAGKAVFDEIQEKVKKLIRTVLKWSAPLWAGLFLCLLFLAVIFVVISGQSEQENTGYDRPSISAEVEQYRELVTQYANESGIPDFVGVILAIIQQESGGKGLDVMQCSECPLNTKYPQQPNGIQDPEYSIQVGVQYFASCLHQAGCTSPEETDKLSLSLQGYNFGGGYIAWALEKYGGYSEDNAKEFSQMKMQELGWSVYGDPYYAQHVLTYYSYQQTREMIYPVRGYTDISSPYGMREMDGKTSMHYGVDFPAPIGTPIVAATDGVVIASEYSTTGYGFHIKIQHANGYITLYAHASELIAQVGDKVQQGDMIARVGSTGNSTGPHCHFEVYNPENQRVDPMELLNEGE